MTALSTQDILVLQALGAQAKLARSRLEHDRAVHAVLLIAQQHRDAEIGWATLARAIGISASTLRAWRRRDRPAKRALPAPTAPPHVRPRPAAGKGAGQADGTSLDATDRLVTSQSQLTDLATISASITTESLSIAEGIAVRPARRRVLIFTGDPRPGRNVFDPEAALIRDQLQATTIGHRHVAMIGLGEIASSIDRERPAVLHVCAHRGNGGLALSLEGKPLFVDPHDLANAIERARCRPRCAILNFCSSAEIAARLARRIPAVIAWPGPVEDEQAACFAGQLYRHIASGIRLLQCVTEAAHVVITCWPQLEAPALHGTWHDPVM
jgi:transposase-like protein